MPHNGSRPPKKKESINGNSWSKYKKLEISY
jgi:hypothetical protein